MNAPVVMPSQDYLVWREVVATVVLTGVVGGACAWLVGRWRGW